MGVEDTIQLKNQRIGGKQFEPLLSRLDDCAPEGDALRLLRSSQFFGGLADRQFDSLQSEGQFKASTIDFITTAHERSTETLQSIEASLTSFLGVLRRGPRALMGR